MLRTRRAAFSLISALALGTATPVLSSATLGAAALGLLMAGCQDESQPE